MGVEWVHLKTNWCSGRHRGHEPSQGFVFVLWLYCWSSIEQEIRQRAGNFWLDSSLSMTLFFTTDLEKQKMRKQQLEMFCHSKNDVTAALDG